MLDHGIDIGQAIKLSAISTSTKIPFDKTDKVDSGEITPDEGMLEHCGNLMDYIPEFIPDTGMETQPFAYDIFDFDDDLTFEDMVSATATPKPTTQAEVRAEFYKTVVQKHVDNMYGWTKSNADIACKVLFDRVLRDYVMNPEHYISEMDGYKFNGVQIKFTEPKVLVHFIYSGIKTTQKEDESHDTIAYASHFSTQITNRCADAAWHTHDLVTLPIRYNPKTKSYNPKTKSYNITEDPRVIRVRYFKHFVRSFGHGCKQCVSLSKSVNRTRILRCDNPDCKRYVKYNGKWNLDAIANAFRYVLRRKLEGVGQKKWIFQGSQDQRVKRFRQCKYPRNHANAYFTNGAVIARKRAAGKQSSSQETVNQGSLPKASKN